MENDFYLKTFLGISLGAAMLFSYRFFSKTKKTMEIDKTAFDKESPNIVITKTTEPDEDITEYIRGKLDEFFVKKIERYDPINEPCINKKIYVDYRLNNKLYSICINGPMIIASDNEQVDSIVSQLSGKKIMMAYLCNKNDQVLITNLLKQFQGPELDFYSRIRGTSKNLNDILYPYDLNDWDTIVVHDLYLDTFKFNLH
jgi:hypothetical protein